MSVRTNKKRKGIGKGSAILITVVVALFAVVIWTRISAAKEKVNDLDNDINELKVQYQEQEDRKAELEERKVYVQTKKYVEQVAKELGLLYPDEMLYKPSK